MPLVYVKPSPGGRVRMPDRNFRPMPAAGAFVPTVDYYNRLIITGDLVITDPPSEPAGGEPTTQPNATPDAATPTPEEK